MDFPCLNEEDGIECDYPMCNCEEDFMEEYLEEYSEVEGVDEAFDRMRENGLEDWPGANYDD